jgi:spermidine/putrescine transport system substrate-binding protein
MVDADIAAMDNPWEAFWDPEYKGIAGLYDEYRETIAVGMYKDGITEINGANPEDLKTAQNNLIELTDLVNIRYTIDGAYAKLPEGVFGIHHAWAGDMVYAPYYMPEGADPSVLRYVWPPKAQGGAGGNVSNDSFAVLKDAEHPVLGHMFLNYMLDDKVAIKNFGWNAYQPPINALDPSTLVSDGTIRENLASTVIVQSDFDMGQIPQQLSPEEDKRWLDAWSRVQQGG